MPTPVSPNTNSHKNLFILILLICGATCIISVKTMKDVQRLTEEILPAEYESYEEVAPLPEETPIRKSSVKRKKIEVTATYRIEDRYVSYGGIEKPDYVGEEEGQVVVNITVNHFGDVKKTSINKASTITDQEVLESARKAALKTDFNINNDAPNLQSGTITYTYKRR